MRTKTVICAAAAASSEKGRKLRFAAIQRRLAAHPQPSFVRLSLSINVCHM